MHSSLILIAIIEDLRHFIISFFHHINLICTEICVDIAFNRKILIMAATQVWTSDHQDGLRKLLHAKLSFMSIF